MAPFAQYYQRVKNVIHACQAVAIFVAWAITIAILTKGGKFDGRIWYYFALCWCCIPALIYQTAFPVFPRIRRFSNAYVHAVIDFLYTIFWLAAFACLIAWVKQGSHAAKDWKSKDSLCNKFAWGPVSKCKLGKDAWILGVIIFLLFAITAAFSVYGVVYYRKNGSLPDYAVRGADHLPVEEQGVSADASDKFNQQQNMHPNNASGGETQFVHTNAEEQTYPSGTGTWTQQQPQLTPAELGHEAVDTSFLGAGRPYEYPQRHQSPPAFPSLAHSPPYDNGPSHGSQSVGDFGPLPMQIQGRPSGHSLALNYEHGGYPGGGRVDFPEGDYGR